MTEQEYIQLIITSIGGDTTSDLLATNLPIYWDLHAATSDDGVRAILVKVDGIRLLLGQNWKYVSFKALDGASVSASDIFDHLLKLLSLAQDELAQAQSVLSGGGALGQLTTTAPINPTCIGQPDPNDRMYRGDPLRRRLRGQPW